MSNALHGNSAVLSSLLWLPFAMFDREAGDRLRKRLTVTVKGFHARSEDKVVTGYVVNQETQQIGVPVFFGLQLLNRQPLNIEIRMANGFPIKTPKRPDPNHPSASPSQGLLMSQVVRHANVNPVTLIKAPTGSGKTVVALNTIAELGRTALVIVGTKVLARQWEKEAIMHLGLTADEIGHVEEGKCVFQDKKLVIAVACNLTQKDWGAWFYNYFGTVVWDEAHRLGAKHFSRTLTLFPAKARIAMTATPTRRDGAEQLFLDYFGNPSVEGTADALECDVRVVSRQTVMKQWKYLSVPSIVSKLTTDKFRNTDIAMIIQTLYRKGRTTLVLSDRIHQLHVLMDMCATGENAIPKESMGLFARQREVDGKRKRVTDAELDEVKANAKVVFSTYGMGKEGLDIPRLDAGIDATPRADGVQAIGRIRRPFPNKKRPVWFTIRDIGIPPLMGYTKSRLREYQESNVNVIDHD